MSDRTGAVFDLGYKPYGGTRLGRAGAIKTIVKDGIRRVLGIRRKARKKVYPWSMVALAIIPAAVFVGLAFTINSFSPDAESPFGGHAEYLVVDQDASIATIPPDVSDELLTPAHEHTLVGTVGDDDRGAASQLSGVPGRWTAADGEADTPPSHGCSRLGQPLDRQHLFAFRTTRR